MDLVRQDIGGRELEGSRVLIVEDEPLVAMMLEQMVEEMGASVVMVAQSLDEAVAAARSCTADVAILDINLRGRMSYPAAAELSRRGVPVLFVTGYARDGIPPELRHAPVLPKPYSHDDIELTLKRLLARDAPVAGHS